MSEKKQNDAETKSVKPIIILPRSLFTGFVGGVIWSICGILLYYFNFSEIAPRTFELRPWIEAGWTDSWIGDIISVLVAGVLSIVPAFIYYGLFKKIKSAWFAVIFGGLLWIIIFYVLNPIFDNIPSVEQMSMTTIVSTICSFILYGTFIGFSISYDYHDSVRKVWTEHS